ncbi:MAG TPA: hypothetical protein VF503_16065 [Sphingobium sp.]|uniref:hypothetical protein n=1 Tax=Sphingobium sp. TaxID=1912891 RepID=UPI002ED37314
MRGTIQGVSIPNGIKVPARAVQIRGETAALSLLGTDNVVSSRNVALGAQIGKEWVVLSGLKPGDKVIVEGWQNVRPGQKAQPRSASARSNGR